jgi:hypothetical protein
MPGTRGSLVQLGAIQIVSERINGKIVEIVVTTVRNAVTGHIHTIRTIRSTGELVW